MSWATYETNSWSGSESVAPGEAEAARRQFDEVISRWTDRAREEPEARLLGREGPGAFAVDRSWRRGRFDDAFPTLWSLRDVEPSVQPVPGEVTSVSPIVKGAVRRNQLISTFGVGSIVALGDESFMVAGIDRWNVGDPDIHEPRLERELGVPGFVRPPAGDDDKRPDIPVVRFPRLSSCPSCHRLEPPPFLHDI